MLICICHPWAETSYLKSLTPPITKTRKATQKVEIGVVWSTQGSLKVTENSIIQQSVYEFLLAFHCNYNVSHKNNPCNLFILT